MTDYFVSNIVTIKSYMGAGLLPLLALISSIYITVTEKKKWIRMIMGVMPLLLTFIFFFPFSRVIFEKLASEENTYYRILWLFPMGVVTAYGAARLFDKHRIIGLIVSILAVIVVSGGSLVYRSQYITKAQNRFHIPDAAINICNIISPEEGADRVRAAFPPELVYFIRQYDTDIMMPYGRDYVEAQWDYWNPVCEQMNVTPDTGYKMEPLLAATRESRCKYLILNMSIPADSDPASYGLVLKAQTDGYSIYLDSEVE
ncbi:hypothetical protein [Butyrivibrio sp. MC2013]|uniref:hypothetical protein n=1 Tax=Butyrivibrio sp. MC2013 TaxID=1280686 RepID=UPI00040E22A7|nr:hypothetical protein [Butyrivibrio sp. MC2013]